MINAVLKLQTTTLEHTLWARIHRPAARNAINFAVMDELEKLVDHIEKRPEIRVFILSGAGTKSFISGGDLREFHTIKEREQAEKMSRRMHSLLNRIESLPCYTIACMNGDAYGGGCEIALAFDFRIAADSAQLGFTQGRFYLPPGWGGLTRLVERTGRSTALRWLAEAAVIDAKTALNRGFLDRIAPAEQLEETTEKWAHALSHNDRDFIAILKQGALRAAAAHREALEAEIVPFTRQWVHPKHGERVNRFLDRNKR